jgi:hypothetical protein
LPNSLVSPTLDSAAKSLLLDPILSKEYFVNGLGSRIVDVYDLGGARDAVAILMD